MWTMTVRTIRAAESDDDIGKKKSAWRPCEKGEEIDVPSMLLRDGGGRGGASQSLLRKREVLVAGEAIPRGKLRVSPSLKGENSTSSVEKGGLLQIQRK